MSNPRIAIVTGGARGIGRTICDGLRAQGHTVCSIDVLPSADFVGDIADPATLRTFVECVINEYGAVDWLINNACLSKGGLEDCDYDDFNYVLRVGAGAPFYLSKLLMPHFRPGASIVNICSTRHLMSQRNTESYSAAKGAIDALTHALANTLAGKVRVNAISPGWIDTTGGTFQGGDAGQHLVGRVGMPEDIMQAVLFLCDETRSGFITGQNLVVDGGMTKRMIYHDDEGWEYRP